LCALMGHSMPPDTESCRDRVRRFERGTTACFNARNETGERSPC
jgi:hypothetical protein